MLSTPRIRRILSELLKMLFLITLVALAIRQVSSLPSPSSIGADLSLLFQNDLNWLSAQDHNGTIMLSKLVTNAQAIASCRMLSETLLPTTGKFFQSDISSLLGYLSYTGTASKNQQFWVASSSAFTCSAISFHGGIQSVSCSSQLPALCSQSAPYRPNTATDMNPNFYVQVTSKKLTVLGTRDHLTFRFSGIPYADPFERFTYSKPFSSQANISALSYGSPCSQSDSGSEDCLFLNIQTPFLPQNGGKSKNLKPVMFWIHGGGFVAGEGSDGSCDGGNLASRGDVVVVSINYRLGTLGFLALNDGVTNGNFGIGDQITALQWVHDHIADFGGDPNKITIFGQSAGAGSVRALLAAKPAFRLFQGAIAQSNLGGFGYAHTYTEWMSIEDQFTNFGSQVVTAVGCGNTTDVLGCLRSIPANNLLNAPDAARYVIMDGKIITTPHLMLDGSGPAAKAHVMFGWMRDDGSDFIGSFPSSTSTLSQQLLGSGLSFNVTNAVIGSSLFPTPFSANETLDLFNVTSRVATDGMFRCIDQATVAAAAKHQVFPSVFTYQFDRSYGGYEPVPGICDPEATPAFPFGNPALPYFRCHSGELMYMFGNFGQSSSPFRDWNDLVLGQVSVDAWSSFARTFDPNPDPAYLSVRGFTNTTLALSNNLWGQVAPYTSGRPVRILDVPLSNSKWIEEAQCDLLGYPLTLFG